METRGPVTVLDASLWQGDIDFEEVAKFALEAGIGGIIIKASERMTQDPKFKQNWDGFGKVGMPRGVYHFARLSTISQSNKDQGKYFADHSSPDGVRPELGYWGDFEDTSNVCKAMGTRNRRNAIWDIIRGFEDESKDVMDIYTAKWWWDGYVLAHGSESSTGIPIERRLWASNPRPAPPPLMPWDWTMNPSTNNWKLWQYSFKGEVPGINAAVDLNTYNGTWEQFREEFHVPVTPPDLPPPPAYEPCRYCHRIPTFEDISQYGTCRGCGAPLIGSHLIARIAGLQGDETLRLRKDVWGEPVGYTWNNVTFPVVSYKMDSQSRAWYQLGGHPDEEGIYIASWYANTEIDK